jgi:Fe-S cluster assembly scaffold protein SufB
MAVFTEFASLPPVAKSLVGSLSPVQDGADCRVLHVPANDAADVRFAIDAVHSHCAVIAESGSRVRVFLELTAAETKDCTIEVFAGPDAHITLLFLARVGSPVRILQRSTIGEGARLHTQNITLGTGAVDHDFRSVLTGAHAMSSLDWAFHAQGEERYKLSARNVFNARDGSGEITIKGVAEDRASAKCDGMIEIGEGGGGTQTYLTEDVLMLDTTAKVDALPALEIRTNDVKASHSATVSRVSEQELFYFAARGIPEAEARHMYVQGFLGDMLRTVENDKWRTAVQSAMEEKYVR